MPEQDKDTLLELAFFERVPGALPLYRILRDRVRATLPETGIEYHKTQITLKNRHGFAFVSLPRKMSDCPGIVVSFGLPYRKDDPRIFISTEPYPNRWTHHALIREAEQIDETLLSFIAEAYAFSAVK